ncbi:periplasmic component of signal transduction system [Oleiphilus messinensis]|uniref:Periplasmic component of signal transduction system n=1 Tax=Oleiphilus messinensis TaxID=141451 RepID=A0A1Y0IAY3_9GAMM|nr:hypothetical protein [Oleiphilus messinensis]ARU56916.1 periplasmic component of signal transduction system [Oleiphilus messinensis]
MPFIHALCLTLSFVSFFSYAEERAMISVVTPEYKGYTNADGSGLIFDILGAVYDSQKYKIKIAFVPWKRAQLLVSKKKAHMMLGNIQHNIIDGMIRPKHPLFVEQTGAIYKKERYQWNGLESLSNKHLVWVRGYSYNKRPELQKLEYKYDALNSFPIAWNRLKNDRHADVLVSSLTELRIYESLDYIDLSDFEVNVLWSENAYIAFSDEPFSKKLAEIYDRKIIDLLESGRLKAMFLEAGHPFQEGIWVNQ